jgi:hypothetical protein
MPAKRFTGCRWTRGQFPLEARGERARERREHVVVVGDRVHHVAESKLPLRQLQSLHQVLGPKPRQLDKGLVIVQQGACHQQWRLLLLFIVLHEVGGESGVTNFKTSEELGSWVKTNYIFLYLFTDFARKQLADFLGTLSHIGSLQH